MTAVQLARVACLISELEAVVSRYGDLSTKLIGQALLSGWLWCQSLKSSEEAIAVFVRDITRLKQSGELI